MFFQRVPVVSTARLLAAGICAAAMLIAVPSSAGAQEAMSKEAAAALRTRFLADLDGLRSKFVALAEAFPQDKYSYRPMDGVRSSSDVFMLVVLENYTMIPSGFGGKAMDLGGREGMTKLGATSDKAQVLDHLNKAFAYSKQELEGLDVTALTVKHRVMGGDRDALDAALLILGDLHEHLGQMIAYARTNHIVPPWSK